MIIIECNIIEWVVYLQICDSAILHQTWCNLFDLLHFLYWLVRILCWS